MRVGGFTGCESVLSTAKCVGESLFTTRCVGSLYRFRESAYATIKHVGVKTESPNLCKPPTRLEAIKSSFPNFYKLFTHFAEVKTSSPDFYNPPTHSVVITTDSLNSHKSPTCFVGVKTDSLNFYKPPTWSK